MGQTDSGAPLAAPLATPSPLSEANPASLDEFMSRDPAGLSDSDLDKMIALYRRQRAIWERSDAEERAKPRAQRSATAKTSLSDLGLAD
jgi:hypothetical protein